MMFYFLGGVLLSFMMMGINYLILLHWCKFSSFSGMMYEKKPVVSSYLKKWDFTTLSGKTS